MTKSVAIIGTRGYPSYYGGFETAVRYLAPYLVDQGWNVSVYGRKGSTFGADPMRDARVRSLTTRGIESKSLSTLSHGFTACLDAAKTKPDVALVMNAANGFFLPLLNVRRVPTLVNVDGMEWERAKWGPVARSVFHTGARATGKFGSRLVYDSLEIARRWKDEFGRDGDFIPYGGERRPPLPIEAGLTHRQYVLVVARFVPENTLPEFIMACEKISKNWPVVFVGSSGYGGELDQRVKSLSERRENVHWLGHVSDDSRLHALWQHAGAYFHGHSVGGTNPALVQAMACGAPTVARDTVYNREVLQECAVFTSPEPDSISAAIASVMSNSEEQEVLSKAATNRAEEFYSWPKVCQKYEQALDRLISD